MLGAACLARCALVLRAAIYRLTDISIMKFTRLFRASLFAGCTLVAAPPALAEHSTTPTTREDPLTDTIIVTASRSGREAIASDAVAAPRQIALPADAAASAGRALLLRSDLGGVAFSGLQIKCFFKT